jgi:hypothetical protein
LTLKGRKSVVERELVRKGLVVGVAVAVVTGAPDVRVIHPSIRIDG